MEFRPPKSSDNRCRAQISWAIRCPSISPKAVYAISQQIDNLSNLPFTPSFQASNLVPGQYVYVTTPAFTVTGLNRYPLPNTLTLVPQSIDGICDGAGQQRRLRLCTRSSLASYDLFPNLAGQQGASNLISRAQLRRCMCTDNAQMLNGALRRLRWVRRCAFMDWSSTTRGRCAWIAIWWTRE